jgi:hypothetical protein
MSDSIKTEEITNIEETGTSSKSVFYPETIEDTPIPTPVVASEVVSEKINTAGGKGTVIDALGLVSVENFLIDNIESYGNSRTTTSTTFTDISNTTLTFETKREARVLFLCSATAGASDWANEGIIRVFIALNIDGTKYPNSTYGFNVVLYWHDTSDAGYTRVRPHWFGSTIVTVPAGSHTAKLQFCRHLLDNLTAEVIDTSLTYIILGK